LNGRATESINNGAPFEIVWNEGISEGDSNGWLAPIGCPNRLGGDEIPRFRRPAVKPQAAFARRALLRAAQSRPTISWSRASPGSCRPIRQRTGGARDGQRVWADNLSQVQRRFERWLQS